MMALTARVDCDILFHEIGYASQKKEGGQVVPQSWDFCQSVFDNRVDQIKVATEADDVVLYITNTPYITKQLNIRNKTEKEKQAVFEPIFRFAAAKDREYKGTRKSERPYHFKNLVNYVLSLPNIKVAMGGLEADDLILIDHCASDPGTSIVCSRDKDLRQVEGLFYSWECGKQPAFGPITIPKLGWLERKDNGKVHGVGLKFFYYQMLVGDPVDNIIGAMGVGDVTAYKILKDLETEREMYEEVARMYVQTYGQEDDPEDKEHWGDWETKLREMADLLWIVRELDGDGKPVMWRKPSA